MEGKRYHWPLSPGGNMGGLMQFEGGYYPPLGKPALTDPGLQNIIEKHPMFGTPNLYEVANPPEPKKITEEERAEILDRASKFVEEQGLNLPLKTQDPPPEEALVEERPSNLTKTDISQANKAKLLHWIKERDIPVPNPASLTNRQLRDILITEIVLRS